MAHRRQLCDDLRCEPAALEVDLIGQVLVMQARRGEWPRVAHAEVITFSMTCATELMIVGPPGLPSTRRTRPFAVHR